MSCSVERALFLFIYYYFFIFSFFFFGAARFKGQNAERSRHLTMKTGFARRSTAEGGELT